MTYYERYTKATSFDELEAMVMEDTKIALFIGANQDRLRAIENAMNRVAFEKGWWEDDFKKKE